MRFFIAILASLSASLSGWGGAAARPPSIAEFLNESDLADIAISPSGASLASLVRSDGKNYLTLTDTESLDISSALEIPDEIAPVWVEWANESRLLVALIAGEFRITSSRITLPSARIVAMDTDGDNAVVLFENQRHVMRSTWNLASITDILPHDPDHVLMPGVRGGDLDLWKVNVNTGEAERVALGRPATVAWKTDTSGAPAFRYDMNSRRTVTRVFAPDAEGRWRRVATVREDDLPAFRPVAVGPEPGQSYVIARPEGADRAAVYLYDVRQNQFIREVANHPRVDIDGVYINPRTFEYLGYYTFDDVFEAQFDNSELQSHIDALREFFGDSTSFSIQDMSDNSQKWIIFASAPNDPGGLYLYHRDRAHLEAIQSSHPTLSRARLSRAQVLRYTASDGLEITGYLTLPWNDEIGPHPLILMPHGGPEARDTFTYNRDVQFLTTRGYAVFQPNFRGSSGYGRAFAEAGYREWGGKMQDDLTDAVAHLATIGVADPDRVCIMGASYGGYAALAGAAFTPDLYQCAISIAGVSDLIDQVRHDLREGDDDEDEYVLSTIGHPRRDRDFLIARSPARQADRIRIPVLLLHGDEDRIVPPDQSETMDRALRRAEADVRYVEIEGASHSRWSDKNQTILYEEIEAFLAEHLPVDAE